MTDAKAAEVDHGKGRWAVWLPIVLSLTTAVGAGGGWLVSQDQAKAARAEKLRSENEALTSNYLVATRTLLARSKQAYDHQQQFSYAGTGTLESYVYYAQDHGGLGRVAELAGIKELAAVNKEIEFRTTSYLPCALTPEYKRAATAFLTYVGLFIRRANAVEALAKTKEPVPTYDTFPSEFPGAVEAEIRARQATDVDKLPPTSCALNPSIAAPEAPK